MMQWNDLSSNELNGTLSEPMNFVEYFCRKENARVLQVGILKSIALKNGSNFWLE